MTPFEIAIRYGFLPVKAHRSRARAWREQALRCPLPVLGRAIDGRPTHALLAAVNDHLARFRYAPDRLWGLDDDYTHPETSQWSLEHGQPEDMPFDCDCLYALGDALLMAAGVRDEFAWGWNLIAAASQQLARVGPKGELGASYNHVILGAEVRTGSVIETAVLDTNTAAQRRILWFAGDRKQSAEAVKVHFSTLYPVRYRYLIEFPYPF